MKSYKCIGRLKDGDKYVGYRLQDGDGNIRNVRDDTLYNAIENGKVIVTNLSIAPDGTFTFINAEKSDLVSSGFINTTNIRAIELLMRLLDTINKSEVPFRIEDCGYNIKNKYIEAYFNLITKKRKEKLEFALRSSNDGVFRAATPMTIIDSTSSSEYANIQDMLDNIVDDLQVLNQSRGSDIWQCDIGSVPNYRVMQKLDKEFNMHKLQGFSIAIFGGNVTLLNVTDTESDILDVPPCINAISKNAFDDCNNLEKLCVHIENKRLIQRVLSHLQGIEYVEYQDPKWY